MRSSPNAIVSYSAWGSAAAPKSVLPSILRVPPCTGLTASPVYAGSNVGGYCDPQAEADIASTESSGLIQAMDGYESYIAKALPVLWVPVPDYALAEINKALKGTGPLDPLLVIYPENWHWS